MRCQFQHAVSSDILCRASFTLRASSWNFAAFPLIFLALLAVRCATIFAINSVTRATGHTGMPLQELLFSSWAGLRGAISLIMAQAVVTDERIASGWSEGGVAQLCLWTAMMVLTSLFLSAPMVPQVLRMTGLHKVSPLKRRIRAKSKRALIRWARP